MTKYVKTRGDRTLSLTVLVENYRKLEALLFDAVLAKKELASEELSPFKSELWDLFVEADVFSKQRAGDSPPLDLWTFFFQKEMKIEFVGEDFLIRVLLKDDVRLEDIMMRNTIHKTLRRRVLELTPLGETYYERLHIPEGVAPQVAEDLKTGGIELIDTRHAGLQWLDMKRHTLDPLDAVNGQFFSLIDPISNSAIRISEPFKRVEGKYSYVVTDPAGQLIMLPGVVATDVFESASVRLRGKLSTAIADVTYRLHMMVMGDRVSISMDPCVEVNAFDSVSRRAALQDAHALLRPFYEQLQRYWNVAEHFFRLIERSDQGQKDFYLVDRRWTEC